MAPKRRTTDRSNWAVSALKAAITIFATGVLGFIGSWGVGLGTSVAKLKEDVEVLKEKEAMTVNLIYPQLLEQTKQLREEIKELRRDVHQLRKP